MIVNTGGRTDTVQYYTPWLLRRFAEGYVLVRNPRYPESVLRYELTPDKVDCVLFCSKDYAPILPHLAAITGRFNTYFFYTVTAYGRDIEPGVPSIDDSVATLLDLERIVGRERLAWRYDPVLVAGPYTPERHLATFEYLAGRLAGHVDRCIFSFVELYDKLRYNMPELVPPTVEGMDALARGLGAIAARRGLPLQICGSDADYGRYGIGRSGCTALDVLGRANGVRFRALKHKGMRPGCHCFESRDIGAYDSCPNGCRYCYANTDARRACANYRDLHDPESPLLLGHLQPGDAVRPGAQKSLLAR